MRFVTVSEYSESICIDKSIFLTTLGHKPMMDVFLNQIEPTLLHNQGWGSGIATRDGNNSVIPTIKHNLTNSQKKEEREKSMQKLVKIEYMDGPRGGTETSLIFF